jgi:hypothetical protein
MNTNKSPQLSSVVIRTAADVDVLLSVGGWTNRSRPRVFIQTPVVPTDEALWWQAQLESLRSECGCGAGRFAVCWFGLALLAFALVDHSSPTPGAVVLRLVCGLVGLVAAGILGKLVGLHNARRRYDQLRQQLYSRLSGHALTATTLAGQPTGPMSPKLTPSPVAPARRPRGVREPGRGCCA